MSNQRMQTLHAIGHSPGADFRNLWYVIEPFPIGQILLMGPPIGQSKIMIMSKSLDHDRHEALRL